ncbi:hypothetical protein ZWY2020_041364 [Hordeum vulgare]|nr:hypothetical protein ZWY2020_041364 [Hordeum vulgare]
MRQATGEATDGETSEATDDKIHSGEIGAATGEEIFPGVASAIGEDISLVAGGDGQIRDGLSELGADLSHRRWEVMFEGSAIDSPGDRHGFIYLHLSSLWITIRDAKGDILAGRYLQKQEFPRVGQTLEIDGFRMIVRKSLSLGTLDKASICDLTSPPTHFGGRFWVLAEEDDEKRVDLSEVTMPDVPTPSSTNAVA